MYNFSEKQVGRTGSNNKVELDFSVFWKYMDLVHSSPVTLDRIFDIRLSDITGPTNISFHPSPSPGMCSFSDY